MEWPSGSDDFSAGSSNEVPLGIQAMMAGMGPSPNSASSMAMPSGMGGRMPLGDFQAALSASPGGGPAAAAGAQAMVMQQGTVRNQEAMMQTAKMFSQAASMVQAAGMAKMLKQIAEWEWAEENDGKKQAAKKEAAKEEKEGAGFDPAALQKFIADAKKREEEEAQAAAEAEEKRKAEEKAEALAKAKMEAEIAASIKRKQEEQDELARLRKRAEEAEKKLAAIEAAKTAPSTALSVPAALARGRSSGSKAMTSEAIAENVQAFAEAFSLEEEPAAGLVRVFLDRVLMGCDLQVDLANFSEHLATSNKPSALVSIMLNDLRKGAVISPCRYYQSRIQTGNLRPGDEIARRFHQGLPELDSGPAKPAEAFSLSSEMAFKASANSANLQKVKQSAAELVARMVSELPPEAQSQAEPEWTDEPPPIEKSGDKGKDDALESIRKTADEVAARIAATVANDRKSAEAAAAAGAGPGGSLTKPKEGPTPSASSASTSKDDAFLNKDKLQIKPLPRSPSRPRAPSPEAPRKGERDYDNRDRDRRDRSRDRRYEGRDRGSDGGFYDRRARSRSGGRGGDRRQRSYSRNRSRSRGGRSPRRSRSRSGNRGLPKESSIPLPNPSENPAGARRRAKSKWDDETPPPAAYKPSAMPKALPQSNNYKVLRLQALQIRSLLGRGGETINEIRRRSGCDIKIHHPPHEPEGTVSIVGNAGLAETLVAQALIMRGCPLATHHSEEDVDDIPIPAHLVGLFIGTAGAQIKELQRMVGDSVGISVQPPKEPGGLQSIRIVGEQREHAKNIIQLKVDAILKGHATNQGQTQQWQGGAATPWLPDMGGKGAGGPPGGGAISL